jgi:taurine dioxygenase
MSTQTAPSMNGSLDRIEAMRLNGTFGARVGGIDLSRPLGSQGVERLKELLRQHKVLTFRSQFAVGPSDLLTFAHRLGTPETAPHPTHADFPGLPGVKVLVSDAAEGFYEDSWHTDGATRESTRLISILQAVDVPRLGETRFSPTWRLHTSSYPSRCRSFCKVSGPFIPGVLRSQMRLL